MEVYRETSDLNIVVLREKRNAKFCHCIATGKLL